MEDMKFLESFRNQINNIDNEFLILLKRRMQISKKIAEFKHGKNMEILQEDRELELILARTKKAREMTLDESFVRDFFELIMDQSKKIQKAHLEKKNKNGN
jgi:chorismate mutase